MDIDLEKKVYLFICVEKDKARYYREPRWIFIYLNVLAELRVLFLLPFFVLELPQRVWKKLPCIELFYLNLCKKQRNIDKQTSYSFTPVWEFKYRHISFSQENKATFTNFMIFYNFLNSCNIHSTQKCIFFLFLIHLVVSIICHLHCPMFCVSDEKM